MTQGASKQGVGGVLSRLNVWAWVGIAVAVAVLGGTITYFAVLSSRSATNTPAGQSAPARSSVASSSADASRSASSSGSASTIGTGSASAGGSGGAAGSSSTNPHGSSTVTKPKLPPQSTLDSLKKGEWSVYGSRTIATGTELHSGSGTDVNGIVIRSDAVTKAAGGGYAHATFEVQFTASGPVTGSGPWKLYGEWVLVPDGVSADKRQFTGGIQGALNGQSSVRPPAAAGSVLAGMNPVGAYRSRGKGIVVSGAFKGNAMFEGVLLLPGVPAPPASKF
jgi:hypothetical protein